MKRLLFAMISSTMISITMLAMLPGAPASADVIGRTSHGRPLVATFQGDPAAMRVIVVIGQMHGNEPGGRGVVDALRARTLPVGTGLWTIKSLNPDGAVKHSRVNGRGVDLNRNFPDRWRAHMSTNPGSHAASERETQAVMRFLQRVRPQLVISYHQAYNVVDTAMPRARPLARAYANRVGMRTERVPCMGPCRGTMIGWLTRSTSIDGFTVELPSHVTPDMVRRHARAVLSGFGELGN